MTAKLGSKIKNPDRSKLQGIFKPQTEKTQQAARYALSLSNRKALLEGMCWYAQECFKPHVQEGVDPSYKEPQAFKPSVADRLLFNRIITTHEHVLAIQLADGIIGLVKYHAGAVLMDLFYHHYYGWCDKKSLEEEMCR